MYFSDVGFDAGGQFEDPEPGRSFQDDGYHRHATFFVSDRYVAGANNHSTEGITWIWRISGHVVKQDGEVRADGRRGSCRVPAADVPQAVKAALAIRVTQRAKLATEQIALYVTALEAMLGG